MKEKSIEIFKFLTRIYAKLKSTGTVFRKIFKISLVNLKQIWIDKTKNVEYGTSIINTKNRDYQLISEIEHSLLEIEVARNIFNNVDEAKLIESAIYLEKAAIKRFDYLTSIAKKKCITVSSEYIVSKYFKFTE